MPITGTMARKISPTSTTGSSRVIGQPVGFRRLWARARQFKHHRSDVLAVAAGIVVAQRVKKVAADR